jgi:hypothetical protein
MMERVFKLVIFWKKGIEKMGAKFSVVDFFGWVNKIAVWLSMCEILFHAKAPR